MARKLSTSTLQRMRSGKTDSFGDNVEHLTFSKSQNSSGDFVGTTGTASVYGYWNDVNGQIIERGMPVLVEYDATFRCALTETIGVGDSYRPVTVQGVTRNGTVYQVYAPAVQQLDCQVVQLKKRA